MDIRNSNAFFKDEKIIHWISRLQNMCKDFEIDLTQANISWILSKPYIDGLVVGTRKLSQLEKFLNVVKHPRIEYSQIYPVLEEGFR